jgi:hypothetical protein
MMMIRFMKILLGMDICWGDTLPRRMSRGSRGQPADWSSSSPFPWPLWPPGVGVGVGVGVMVAVGVGIGAASGLP